MKKINSHLSRRSSLRASAAGIALGLYGATMSMAAAAQDASAPAEPAAEEDGQGLREILVTSERRVSTAQRTAASVTVQDGEDLLERGKFTLRNILETVPGVSGGESEGVTNEPTGNDSPGAGITIRGISSNGGPAGVTLSGVPAVAVYADGVYGGIGGSYDIERVEVLRGPQGTLYGRSATAGLVAIHTRNPDLQDLSVEGTLEMGSFDLLHATAVLNVPLVEDRIALRVSANQYQRDGADVDVGYGASNTTEAKAKLLFQPTEGFSLLVGAAIQDRTLYNGGAIGNLVSPDEVVYQAADGGRADTQFRQVWAEANFDIGDLRLTYLPAFRAWEQDATVLVVGPAGAIIRQEVDTPEDEFITQELRLSSGAGSAIAWQTGLFYYNNDLSSVNANSWNSSSGLLFRADVRRKTEDIGVFAEATVPIADAFRITAGLRYDHSTVETTETYTANLNNFCNTPIGFLIGCAVAPPNAPNAGLPQLNTSLTIAGDAGRRVFENLTYKVRGEVDLSPANLLYASVSTAVLPGDVQIATGAGGLPAVYVYGSERLTAYELGSKNRFLDRRLQVNFGVFHYNYGGYQANLLLDARDPGSAFQFSVPLRVTGAELETLLQVTPQDQIGFNFSQIETQFHDLPAGFAAVVAQRELWGIPSTTATLFYGRDFSFIGGSSLNFHAEGIYRGAYDVLYISPALAAQGGLDYQHQEPVILGNINLTWTSADERLSLTGYVRNVFNERFKTYTNVQSITPLQATANQSDPRAFGVVASARF